MQNIPLAQAAPEMVLARELKRADNPDGPPICGRGIILTEALIERLKRMGIQSVVVEGHPVWNEGDETVAAQLATLDRRFSRVTNDPLMRKLQDIYRAQIKKSMGEQDG